MKMPKITEISTFHLYSRPGNSPADPFEVILFVNPLREP
jgi:hypothetical protein